MLCSISVFFLGVGLEVGNLQHVRDKHTDGRSEGSYLRDEISITAIFPPFFREL